MRLMISLVLTVVLATTANAQVFKCTDGSGKTTFSEKPCALDQSSSTVRIFKEPPPAPPAPNAPARLSLEAQAHEANRQQLRAESDENHRRIKQASNEVWRIRDENADPQKCREVRARMAQMQRRDPLLYKIEPDYPDFQQKESLYCGN